MFGIKQAGAALAACRRQAEEQVSAHNMRVERLEAAHGARVAQLEAELTRVTEEFNRVSEELRDWRQRCADLAHDRDNMEDVARAARANAGQLHTELETVKAQLTLGPDALATVKLREELRRAQLHLDEFRERNDTLSVEVTELRATHVQLRRLLEQRDAQVRALRSRLTTKMAQAVTRVLESVNPGLTYEEDQTQIPRVPTTEEDQTHGA